MILLALYDSHTLSALQLCFRKPSRYMHHEIYQTRSLSVTCSLTIRIPCRHCNYVFASPVGTCITRFIKRGHFQLLALLRFAYPVGTATMFSQAQSVHASRDLSYAVTFSYLLAIYDSHTLSAPAPKSFASPVGTCI